MAFDPKILDTVKDELRNKVTIDPNEVLLKEKVKGKSAGLARLVEDLYSNKPIQNNHLLKLNEAVQQKKVDPNMVIERMNAPQAPLLENFNDYKPYNGIEYNEYNDDEDDAAMEHRIRLAEQELLNKRKQPMNEYGDVQTYRPQQPVQQPQQRPTYQHNMDIREELLSLFTKDYILKTIKEYIKEDPNFKATIVDIVKSSFGKKKNE